MFQITTEIRPEGREVPMSEGRFLTKEHLCYREKGPSFQVPAPVLSPHAEDGHRFTTCLLYYLGHVSET